MLCRLNQDAFPPNFVSANYSLDALCVLTTKECNYLVGWCFIAALVFQTVYVAWRLYRDMFGKCRIHKLVEKFGRNFPSQEVIRISEYNLIVLLAKCVLNRKLMFWCLPKF